MIAAVDKNPRDHLAPRELEVMRRLAEGQSSADVAEAMNISASTLAAYRRNVSIKLDLRNLADITRCAIAWRVISCPVWGAKHCRSAA